MPFLETQSKQDVISGVNKPYTCLLLLLTVLAFSVGDTKQVVLCDAEKAEILHLFPVDHPVSCMHWMEVQNDSRCVLFYWHLVLFISIGFWLFSPLFHCLSSLFLKLVIILWLWGWVQPFLTQTTNITKEVSVRLLRYKVYWVCQYSDTCCLCYPDGILLCSFMLT